MHDPDQDEKQEERVRDFAGRKHLESRYHSLFELAPDGIVITNMSGVISSVNSAALRLSGYSKDELVGEHFSKLLYVMERDIPRFFKLLFNSSQQGVPKPFAIRISRRDGTLIWAEAHIGFLDEGSSGKDIQIILRDITDRKRNEEEILFKNTLLEAQHETSLDGILVVDREGKVILFNKRFGEMWGIPQEILNTRSRIQYLWHRLSQIREPKGFMKKVEYLYEHEDERSRDEIELKNGRIFDRYSSPLIDSTGEYHGRIWFFRDITERKMYEEKLKALHRHSVELGEAETIDEVAESTLSIIEETLGFKYLGFGVVEGGFLRFKYTRGVTAVSELSLEGPGLTVRSVKMGETQLVHNTRTDKDYISRRFKGEPESLSELDVPVIIGGEVVAVINIENEKINAFTEEDKRLLETLAQHVASAIAIIRQRDSLQKYLEELERSNRELDDYTYVVSHDLKAPLRSITAFSNFLLEDYLDKLDETGQGHLERIKAASTRMDRLIKDLLTLSRVGRKYMEKELVDLNGLIKDIESDFETQLIESGAEILVSKLPEVWTQRVWMRQLLSNLIGNGLKFNNSPTPIVELGCMEREGDYLFSVKDNGIGVREEDQQRLFKLFQRFHTQEEYEGTGAGLAICKKIVETFGGEIWVESKPGEGSTFYFTYKKEKSSDTEMRVSQPQIVHGDVQVQEEPQIPLE